MNFADDKLYRIHRFQAARRNVPPLDHEEFIRRLNLQSDTDLSQMFLPHPGTAPEPVIALGEVYATPSALLILPLDTITCALISHGRGKGGEVKAGQWMANDLAPAMDGTIRSVHRTRWGTEFWILTDVHRHCTVVKLPEDKSPSKLIRLDHGLV